MISIPLGFLLFLAITLAFLGAVVYTGFKARRRQHIPLVICAVISLGITIYYAEQLGTLYDLESSGRIYPIHLFLAKTTTACYLLPVIFGVLTIRDRKWLKLHRKVAFFVLLMTVLTAATGSAMVYLSDKL